MFLEDLITSMQLHSSVCALSLVLSQAPVWWMEMHILLRHMFSIQNTNGGKVLLMILNLVY